MSRSRPVRPSQRSARSKRHPEANDAAHAGEQESGAAHARQANRLLALRRRDSQFELLPQNRCSGQNTNCRKFRGLRAFARFGDGGTVPAYSVVVSQTVQKSTDSVQAQVEALTTVAKKLSGEGKEVQALEAYRTASGLMPGAPWLQHRTAELARKLKQPEVAALHYRRAAAAFIRAGFPKRALAPLRTAWQVSVGLLPGEASTFINLVLELVNVQRELGFSSDAKLTLSNSNLALRTSGSPDRIPSAAEFELHSSRPPSDAPDSGVVSNVQSSAAEEMLSRLQTAVKP